MTSYKIKKAFDLEEKRDLLASKDQFNKEEYRSLYAHGLDEIRSVNIGVEWDNIFKSKNYNEIISPITSDRFNLVVKLIQKEIKNKRIKLLDIGFGYCYLEDKLKNVDNILISGIDLSLWVVNNANNNYLGEFKLGSIIKIPFNDNEFDLIALLEVLEHIPPSKTFKALSEVHRVLKKGGLVVLSIPLNEGLYELILKNKNLNHHCRAYTYNIISKELDLSGFKVLKHRYLYAFNKNYRLKSIIMHVLGRINIFNFKIKPNNIIILAQKK